MDQSYALITGASMGLGRAFAYEFASRGYNLLLVSLPNQDIESVADECRSRYGIECRTFELDLTSKVELMAFIEEVKSKYEVSVLVNNAGIGGSQSFSTVNYRYIENMLMLNIFAATTLTHQLLPILKRQHDGYILNISSMASLTPTGYKTVYPASKAYIRHLSIGLREELRGSGVHVSTAILGPMPTQADIIRRIETQGKFGKMLTIDPKDVACKCADGLFAKKGEITIGGFNQLTKIFLKFAPYKLIAKVMTKKVKNEIE